MFDSIASSDGWITLDEGEFEKTIELENYVGFLRLAWGYDTTSNSLITIYLNDDPSAICFDANETETMTIGAGLSAAVFEFKGILIHKFRIVFPESNPSRKVKYFGYY